MAGIEKNQRKSSKTENMSLHNAELKFLERLAETDPSSPALLSLSRTYLVQKQYNLAEKVARGVLDAHPDNLEAALLVAQAMIKLGQAEKAKVILKRASKRLTDLASIFKELAHLFEITGETPQALKFLKAYKALSLYESESEAPEELLFELEPIAAEQAVTEAVPTETLAGLYLEQGLINKALETYEKILDLEPGNERIRNKIVDIYLGKGEQLPDFEPPRPTESKDREARKRLIEKLQKLQLAVKRRRAVIEASI